jgi:pimeloyl-ACP methyl ester carboxylesterase
MSEITSHEAVIAGLKTKYYTGGSEKRPAVVLVHDGSYGSDALLSFGAVAESLASEYYVILPDLLGWGGSAKAHFFDQSLYEPRINQVRGLLEHLGVVKAHFVGNSFGGSLILRGALGVAGGLPALSVVSIAGTGGPWRSQIGMTAMADYQSTEAEAKRVSDLVVTEEATDGHVRRRYENSLLPGHWESLRAWGLKNPELRDAPALDDNYPASLNDLGIPIAVVEGKQDVMVDAGWADRVVAAAPRVEGILLDSGHSPNIDQPDVIAQLLSDRYRAWN